MHIPDGFLNNQAAFGLGAAAAGAVAHSFVKVKSEIKVKVAVLRQKLAMNNGTSEDAKGFGLSLSQKLQDMATLGGLIFALQMLNFPVRDGTSGHFLGAVLATAVVGPYAAILVMTAVVAIQALLFADGGMLALGANVFNMAILGVLVATAWFSLIRKQKTSPATQLTITALAAWSSIVAAAIGCSFEIALSGRIALSDILSSMVTVHALIGIGEVLLTLVALKLFFPKRKLYSEQNDKETTDVA